MDNPAHKNDPEETCENEEENRRKQPPLNQLSQSGDEEARKRSDNITRGSLTRCFSAHGKDVAQKMNFV